jgi:hypothetical protein
MEESAPMTPPAAPKPCPWCLAPAEISGSQARCSRPIEECFAGHQWLLLETWNTRPAEAALTRELAEAREREERLVEAAFKECAKVAHEVKVEYESYTSPGFEAGFDAARRIIFRIAELRRAAIGKDAPHGAAKEGKPTLEQKHNEDATVAHGSLTYADRLAFIEDSLGHLAKNYSELVGELAKRVIGGDFPRMAGEHALIMESIERRLAALEQSDPPAKESAPHAE